MPAIVRPDGPRGDLLIGSARAIFRNPLRFNCEMRDYGPISHATIGPARIRDRP